MKPIFTIHEGEFLVGDHINRKFGRRFDIRHELGRHVIATSWYTLDPNGGVQPPSSSEKPRNKMNHNDIFGATMAGLEAGFKVLHISTHELSTCTADSDVNEVLSDPSQSDYDYIPVKSDDRIVGVLDRGSQAEVGTVRHHMRPLEDSMLVCAE